MMIMVLILHDIFAYYLGSAKTLLSLNWKQILFKEIAKKLGKIFEVHSKRPILDKCKQ